MKAIVLAGGLGKRLRPLTIETPKPLLPIKGKPLLEWVILNLKRNGITDIVLSIGYKAERIKKYFKDGSTLKVTISYNVEDTPLGTGGAVKDICTKMDITEPFILVWGDNAADYNFKEMIEAHKDTDALLTMALTAREDVENFGAAELDNKKIISFTEKPPREKAPSNFVNAGAFIVNPDAIDVLPEGVSSIERDCFEKLCGPQGRVYAYIHEGYWLPIDTMEKYQQANREFPGINLE
jgi:mannose-1-phosphate guanylyltransferase